MRDEERPATEPTPSTESSESTGSQEAAPPARGTDAGTPEGAERERVPYAAAERAASSLDAEHRRDFAVVVPAFDEAAVITDTIRELREAFERYDLRGEVVIVDDGSTDGTPDVARREGGDWDALRVVSHRTNLGKTEAMLTGAAATDRTWLVLFDADLQHRPDEIPRFLATLQEGWDIVTGRKVGRYDKQGVSSVYNALSRRIFQVPVSDLNSMKAFRREILDRLHLRHDWHRFFVVLAHARGWSVTEIDIELLPRRAGISKYTGLWRVMVGVLDLVAVWFLLLFSRKPMMLFGTTGIVLIALGALVGVVAFVLRFGMGFGFRPFLYLVILLETVGFLLFGFGLVAELIAELRDETDALRRDVRRLAGGGRRQDGGGPPRGRPARGMTTARRTGGTAERRNDRPRVLVLVGTRPEAIKMSPVLSALERHGDRVETRLTLTGQHTDLVDQVLDVFGMEPAWDLEIMREGQDLYDVAHRCLDGLREVLAEWTPDEVLVQGDTATVCFGALAAFFERTRVGHVEAGLRSHDKWAPFPEEIFRRLTDVLTDDYFAPTPRAADNLRAEGVPSERIHVTGNTVVDAMRSIAERDRPYRDPALSAVAASERRLVLLTAHRRESFGAPLRDVFAAVLELVEGQAGIEVVYPVHPNPKVREPAAEILGRHPRVHLTGPVDYLDLVRALRDAALVLTDSGGIQEEAPTFGTPVLVLREVTERPEGVEAGVAELVGTDPGRIVARARAALAHDSSGAPPANPYGDGRAGERIADIVVARLTGAERRTSDWRPDSGEAP